MSYNAVVLPVMIASPSDVQPERKLVREVLHEWNDLNAHSKQLVLLPVGWETHTSPELGNPAQEQINTKVLGKCDILIAIFWNRIGTPTQTESSGTIEEIKKHYDSGKTTLVYFSKKPVVYEDVDHDQKLKLDEFKQWCMQNGLIQNYDNEEDFKKKLEKQIQISINDSNYITNILNNNTAMSGNGSSVPVVPSVDAIILSLDERSANLLIAASQDNDGSITKMAYMGGDMIMSNGQSFNQNNSPRDRAFWSSVLSRFIDQGLLEPVGSKGQIFRLTKFGFEVADQLISA